MSTTGTTIDPERQMLGEVDMVGQERWEEIHRRDRLSTDRPSGGHAVLPAHQPPLRTRADDPHQQLELRKLGRRLRRPRDRQHHPRPDPASGDDNQHSRRLLPVEGRAEVRGRQADDDGNLSNRTPMDSPRGGGIFDDRSGGILNDH